MQYILSLLEGIITFISPCLLPMLPIYLSFFAGGSGREKSTAATLKNAFGFVCGFTFVFLMLGAFAGSIGMFLRRYTVAVNFVTGLIVILFGLNFLGLIRIDLLNKTYRREMQVRDMGFFSSVLFGLVFSVGWTPCVGAFLGSALMLASQQGSAGEGMLMLLFYSMGLGIPFIISAVLIRKLQSAFRWIKTHYRIINLLSGALLVIVGILMMTGLMGYFLALLTF